MKISDGIFDVYIKRKVSEFKQQDGMRLTWRDYLMIRDIIQSEIKQAKKRFDETGDDAHLLPF